MKKLNCGHSREDFSKAKNPKQETLDSENEKEESNSITLFGKLMDILGSENEKDEVKNEVVQIVKNELTNELTRGGL